MRFLALFSLCVLVAFGASRLGASDSVSMAKVVVALKPDKNPDLMLQEKAALAAFLGAQLGRPVEVIIPLSSAVIIEGLANGTIDLGYLSASDMLNVRDRAVASVLLAGEFPDGKTSYESYWVVKKDAPYQSIEALRGRPIAFASRTSTSGFVLPLLDLQRRGLLDETANPESFFGRGQVMFGVGYVSAIERVLAGEAEAAAVSYYVLDLGQHLTVAQRAQLRRLQAQGPVPSHVIAVRSSLGSEDVAKLRTALLALNEPGQTELRDKLFTTKLVAVDADTHLAPLAEGLALARKALRQ
jgi:phosphonate transport system substrate-binding protein